MLESLLALPLLLLAGLSILQVALLLHARDALQLAALEAARAGSVGRAEPAAIEAGMARGLVPLLAAGSGSDDPARQLGHAADEARQALRGGWARWRQLSPTRESFADWGRPARDRHGGLPAGIAIPVDHVATEALSRRPASGVIGARAGAPIGAASGQTLTDATLLRIELVWGVPAAVPIAGPLIAFTLAAVEGCRLPRMRRIAAVDLGEPGRTAEPRAWTCRIYAGGADDGRPRIPVRASALVRMQSDPVLTAATPPRVGRAP